MSLHIILFNHEHLFVAADKRVSKLEDLSFVNDGAEKVHVVNEKLLFSGGTVHEMHELLSAELSKISHLPVETILKRAKAFNRNYQTEDGAIHGTPLYLCGVNDSNQIFIWFSSPCGEEKTLFPRPEEGVGYQIFGMGDASERQDSVKTNTIQEVARMLNFKMKYTSDALEILKESIGYASFIDPVVSPTFDFFHLQINKTNYGN